MEKDISINQSSVRPTKKQFEILEFIEKFINEHGYSPSYREIMSSLNYTSVSTVAMHVNSLLKRGHLIKREHSARSIEIVNKTENTRVKSNLITAGQEKWLVDRIELKLKEVSESKEITKTKIEELYVLSAALRILNIEGAANSINSKILELKARLDSKE
jgi:SOS-response transcriptional repressor LexA